MNSQRNSCVYAHHDMRTGPSRSDTFWESFPRATTNAARDVRSQFAGTTARLIRICGGSSTDAPMTLMNSAKWSVPE